MCPGIYKETPSCKACKKLLHVNLREISCTKCSQLFHIKCTSNLKSKSEYFSLKLTEPWTCHLCIKPKKKKLKNVPSVKKALPCPLQKLVVYHVSEIL